MIPMPTEREPVVVVEGDCLELLRELPAGCVDAVVTDPPYPSEFLHLWRPFASEAYRLLREGGELVTLLGHYQLPQVMAAFATTEFRYWWICGMRQHARGRLLGKRVNVYFKPALWYVKGKKRRLSDMPSDLVLGTNPEKVDHEWEQGSRWFSHWCNRICERDEVILDPFAGSGTTGVAAILEGRRCILIEKEPAYAAICRRRIAEAMGRGPGQLPFEAANLFGDY